jgi:hypothetical protein
MRKGVSYPVSLLYLRDVQPSNQKTSQPHTPAPISHCLLARDAYAQLSGSLSRWYLQHAVLRCVHQYSHYNGNLTLRSECEPWMPSRLRPHCLRGTGLDLINDARPNMTKLCLPVPPRTFCGCVASSAWDRKEPRPYVLSLFMFHFSGPGFYTRFPQSTTQPFHSCPTIFVLHIFLYNLLI